MGDAGYDDERIWERGWEGHELAQRRRLARLPLAEKIRWLEQAQRIAEYLAAQRRGEKGPPQAGGGC